MIICIKILQYAKHASTTNPTLHSTNVSNKCVNVMAENRNSCNYNKNMRADLKRELFFHQN